MDIERELDFADYDEAEDQIKTASAVEYGQVSGYTILARVVQHRDNAGKYNSYLVVRSEGKTWPYLYIPEEFPQKVLEEILKKLKA